MFALHVAKKERLNQNKNYLGTRKTRGFHKKYDCKNQKNYYIFQIETKKP